MIVEYHRNQYQSGHTSGIIKALLHTFWSTNRPKQAPDEWIEGEHGQVQAVCVPADIAWHLMMYSSRLLRTYQGRI